MIQALTAQQMDNVRTAMYGRSARLTFYTVTPADGEAELAALKSGWHAYGLADKASRAAADVVGAVKCFLAAGVNLSIDDLRGNAVADLTIGKRTRRYAVADLKEQQQLGAGWVLILTPMADGV